MKEGQNYWGWDFEVVVGHRGAVARRKEAALAAHKDLLVVHKGFQDFVEKGCHKGFQDWSRSPNKGPVTCAYFSFLK